MLSSHVVVGATFGVEALLLAMAAAMQVHDDEATQSDQSLALGMQVKFRVGINLVTAHLRLPSVIAAGGPTIP